LRAICIPGSVQEISQLCFYGCTHLVSVTFEENSRLLVIRSFAFACCVSLRPISLPSSIHEISDFAFFSRENCVHFPSGSGWSVSNVANFPSPVFRRSSERILSGDEKLSGRVILCRGFPQPRHAANMPWR
jgi:hypothetical protein